MKSPNIFLYRPFEQQISLFSIILNTFGLIKIIFAFFQSLTYGLSLERKRQTIILAFQYQRMLLFTKTCYRLQMYMKSLLLLFNNG